MCQQNKYTLIFRNPKSVLEIDQDIDLFKLNDEIIVKRVERVPSPNAGAHRGFVMLSSDRLLSSLLGWSNKGVMDGTFKAGIKIFVHDITIHI